LSNLGGADITHCRTHDRERLEKRMDIAATEQPNKRRRGDGRPFPRGFSGNPKGRAAIRARAAELFGIMAGDFAPLSAVDTVLLNQACLLLARSERVHRVRDIDVGLRMSGEARRLLQALRKRAPVCSAPIEMFTDIAAKAQTEEAARRAAPGHRPATKRLHGPRQRRRRAR
jgi:hypothetical protein